MTQNWHADLSQLPVHNSKRLLTLHIKTFLLRKPATAIIVTSCTADRLFPAINTQHYSDSTQRHWIWHFHRTRLDVTLCDDDFIHFYIQTRLWGGEFFFLDFLCKSPWIKASAKWLNVKWEFITIISHESFKTNEDFWEGICIIWQTIQEITI